MQKGTLMIFAGLAIGFAGVVTTKWTGLSMFWAVIALGAVIAVAGGIRNSQPA
jgi:hypothetical protein